jgi:hypothetical protein
MKSSVDTIPFVCWKQTAQARGGNECVRNFLPASPKEAKKNLTETDLYPHPEY